MLRFETAEQLEIRESVRKLARREIPRFQTTEHYGTVPRELFNAFADLGLAGLSVAEEFGGLAAGPVSTMLAIEEVAAVDCGAAVFLSVHSMVSGLLQRSGSAEQKAKYLPQMASGKLLGAFALTEPGAGSDAAGLRSTAKETADGFSLTGEKCYITSAGFADLYLVFAKTDPERGGAGISAFIVEPDCAGLSISAPERKMGADLSPIASLSFSEAPLQRSALLGSLHEGYRIALGGLAGGRINVAAAANGISRNAIELAQRHLQERTQFGQVLASFQGLQFMLADMRMKLEAAQLLTWQAARLLEEDPGSAENRINPAMAKCFATDTAMSVATDAVQLLGGAGYIREYGVEQLMRDAKMLQIVEGTNQIQRMVIAREMLRA